MKLIINNTETIGDLRNRFSASFPFLRIDFFRAIAGDLPFSAYRVTEDDVVLDSIRNQYNEGVMEILGSDRTGEVEKKFLKHFGLHAQIFRQSGNTWLLTTTTDNYTLDHQNRVAEEMFTSVSPPEPEDIHEQA